MDQTDASNRKVRLLGRINQRSARIGVVGLGYVGLPLACSIAESGFHVVGIDSDDSKVGGINAGRSHIEDVTSSRLANLKKLGRLTASTNYELLNSADAVIIAVPTPVDEYRVPDLRYVRSASLAVAAAIPVGALVVLESTSYPGTTEEVLAEAIRDAGHRPGVDVFIGYSPERIDPGNREWRIENTPKVVSGLTADCLELTCALYGSVVSKLVPVSDIRTAEIGKLFENIFRGVNIALVNEFQTICDAFGIDVWEVIEACSTKPYGFMTFYPGPGIGGHCLPVDPSYLAWKARQLNVNTEFIELSARINASMPDHVVQKVIEALNRQAKPINGARVGLVGVAYKRNSSDIRESPAVRIVELLLRVGADVSFVDPYVQKLAAGGRLFESASSMEDFVAGQDCVVIVTDHDSIDWSLVATKAAVIVDTRNAIRRRRERLVDGETVQQEPSHRAG